MKKKYEEERLQMSCVLYFDLQYPRYRLLLHHSPNGGFRTSSEASIFKAMGTRAGFPDLLLLLPTAQHTALAIEMKTDKGKQTDNQRRWQQEAERVGVKYEVVRSAEEFIKITQDYIQEHERYVENH